MQAEQALQRLQEDEAAARRALRDAEDVAFFPLMACGERCRAVSSWSGMPVGCP